MPNFKTFTQNMAALTHAPTLTLQKSGVMSLNRAAFVAMGEPERVELLFDEDEKIIGIQPSDERVAHSFQVRPQREGVGPYMVAGSAFTKYFKIDTTVSRRWIGEMDDGVLCIDLKREGAVVTSNRRGRTKQEPEPAET